MRPGRWPDTPSTRNNVLQVAVEGSKRTSGILASELRANPGPAGNHLDWRRGGMPITLGPADRYLIRGFSWLSDDSTTANGGITNPFDLRQRLDYPVRWAERRRDHRPGHQVVQPDQHTRGCRHHRLVSSARRNRDGKRLIPGVREV